MTTYLATVIGWYLVIFSLFLAGRQKQLKLLVDDLVSHRGLFFILAFVTLLLGLMLVASHNIWVLDWPVIITVFGWLVVFNGAFRLFFPEKAGKAAANFVKHPARIKVVALILFLVGLMLLAHVYYNSYFAPKTFW